MSRDIATPMNGLTPADIALVREIAIVMVYVGRWQSICRASDLFCDYFEARLEDNKRSRLMLGILHGRHYFCMDGRTSAVHIGDTLAQVARRAGLPLPSQFDLDDAGSSYAENEGLGVTRSQ